MSSSINASLTAGVVMTSDTSGVLNLQSGGTTVATVSSTGLATTGITNSALTSGRVTFASTGGLLADSADLIFNGTTLGVGTTLLTGLGRAINIGSAAGTTRGILLKRSDTNADTAFWYSDDTNMYLGSNNGFTSFNNAGSERMRLDSSGNLGLGTASPSTYTTGFGTGLAIASPSNGGYLPAISLAKTGAASGGAQTWTMYVDNTRQFTLYNFTSSADAFAVNTNGAVSLQGAVKTATGVGITFPATQSASTDANCLDDYEEGTWTPTFTSTGATFAYNSQIGYYTKIGNSVTVTAYLSVPTKTGTLTNSLTITGLPFASKSGASASGVFGVEQFTVRPTLFSDTISSSSLIIYQAGTVTAMTPTLMTTLGFYLFTITYFTA